MSDTPWRRYVAVGDSITEGFCDPGSTPGEAWLGWADRLARILDGNARIGGRSIEFANLAVRGRRVADVVQNQIPGAINLKADLVSVMIGGNDLMGARADPDNLAAELESGITSLRAAGADVLLANCFDPQFAIFLKPLRGRAAVFNGHLWSIARTHGTFMLDVWGIREFHNRLMWAEDRVHLTAAGHRLLASRAAHCLGVPYFELGATDVSPLPSSAAPLATLPWLRRYALPWVGRRLRGISAGDGLSPKLPSPVRVSAPR
ncbi:MULTISPECIES: SGNH/GDSL hydrolase family protein [unclassified Diaminobutyricimonas]|uniref:SGNH/GDSL hydrolase family protein n=1 Tax=unclassified Diaminobutyricimonas TaxID=2643261 RepID=UPI0012F4998C|nr:MULTISPECIES: SGNH/GDSL hydrolase family protein [unclassified Diaminobutyricimonas]